MQYILLQETYGKSKETSLWLIFSTFVSLLDLIFKSTQICQQIWELYKIDQLSLISKDN